MLEDICPDIFAKTRYYTPNECFAVFNRELGFVLLPNNIRRPNGREYMTNAEKYKEVFGMDVDPKNCPTAKCLECPCVYKNEYNQFICNMDTRAWWLYEEYKGVNNGKEETT